MKAGQIVKSILSADKGTISSKRLCGILGWIICLFILVFCTISNTQAPEFSDYVVITSASLLGVDSIMAPWTNRKKHGINSRTN